MSNPEQHRNPYQPDKPKREQLAGNEVDLTGVVEQTDLLITTISQTIRERSPDALIPELGARTMARYLANQFGDHASALHQFAATGSLNYVLLTGELAMLWDEPRSEFTSAVLAHLDTYVIETHNRQHREAEAVYSPATRALIAELGPPFAAFLTLPDVTEDSARELFHQLYFGGYPNTDGIAADVADAFDVQPRLEAAELDNVASPDHDLLLKLAKERWDIVHYNGNYYLFEK